MVSQPYPSGTAPVSGTLGEDRGIREAAAAPVYAGYGAGVMPYASFWGSVIAGTLVAITFSILSYSLMFGFKVGLAANGTIDLTWGSGVWMVVTTCIAYFLGGWVASCISHVPGIGWLRGLSVWGLSLPLTAVVISFIAAAIGLAYGLNANAATAVPTGLTPSRLVADNFVFLRMFSGTAWTMFIALLLGGLCALAGGIMGSTHDVDINAEHRVLTTGERR
jgi:hypothetical protein